jgi:hypothetical protein
MVENINKQEGDGMTDELMARAMATGYGADEFRPYVTHDVPASRPSRGRADGVDAGTVSRCSAGIGIVAKRGQKRCIDGEWLLCWTIRPPATEGEREQCARAMLRRWCKRMEAVAYSGGPDDDRDVEAWQKRQAELAEVRAMVMERAGR